MRWNRCCQRIASGESVAEVQPAPSFGEAAFALADVDSVSEAVKAGDRYYVIQLQERIASRVPSLDEVREKVTAAYRTDRAREIARQRADRREVVDDVLPLPDHLRAEQRRERERPEAAAGGGKPLAPFNGKSGTFTVAADGTWSYTTATALAEGAHSVVATAPGGSVTSAPAHVLVGGPASIITQPVSRRTRAIAS